MFVNGISTNETIESSILQRAISARGCDMTKADEKYKNNIQQSGL